MLDTVREYVLERLDEGGGLAAARGAHAEYFAALADEARLELRGREWLRWQRRLELENDNLWAALAYARDASDPAVAVRLGTLGWYFALGDRVSEGRRFLELALSAASDEAPVELRIELLADLCYLATEELDLGAALAAGERAVSLAATAAAPWELGFAQLMLSLARCAIRRRGTALPRLARRRVGDVRGGVQTTGASRRPTSSARSGRRKPATSLRSPRWRRRPAVTPTRSATTRFAYRRCCWRRGARSNDANARPRSMPTGARSSSPGASGSATTLRSRSPASGRTRSRDGDLARGRGAPAAGASPLPRPPRRPAWPPMRASSSAGSPRRPATRTRPSGCTARSSSGRRRSARTRLARACSSRSPAVRPRGAARARGDRRDRGDTASAADLRGRAGLALT